jgi:hypothetical protein
MVSLTPAVKFDTGVNESDGQFAAAAVDTGGAPCIANSFTIFFSKNGDGDLSGPVEEKTLGQKSPGTLAQSGKVILRLFCLIFPILLRLIFVT